MARSLRVLLVTNLFPPDVIGGYELLARDVALALRARGHDVHVLTTGTSSDEDPPWVHRRLTLVRPFGAPADLDRFAHARHARREEARAAEVLERGFDCAVVCSMRRLGMHACRAIVRAGVPAVFLFNDDWLLAHRPAEASSAAKRLLWGALERVALGARTWRGVPIERAIYVSASIRKALVDGGAPVPTGVVCFQGVDRAVFRPRSAQPIGLAPKLLYTGRVHPTKGVDVAIAALAHVRAAGLDASLTVVGAGADEELARLDGIARRLGVRAAIDFRGFVARASLGDVYRAHDVFLFPSLWEEPAGLTYLEAMACGVPVVALARGGAKEVLEDGVNCVVAADATGLGEGVLALAGDPERVARIVRGGAVTVAERASLDRYVDAIERELGDAAKRAA